MTPLTWCLKASTPASNNDLPLNRIESRKTIPQEAPMEKSFFLQFLFFSLPFLTFIDSWPSGGINQQNL